MKIAIHHRPGSFSDGWIDYCRKKSIDYKLVNAFSNDIVYQVEDCDVFMWHHHHNQHKDVLAAKKVLFALEHAGVKVFPDFKTAWHFDDKVAQKYLLEAIDAPLVPSYVFYEKNEALEWARSTSYPKVFKLKGGAGAKNVRLVKDYKSAKKLIIQSFSRGFSQFDKVGNFKERLNKFRHGQGDILDVGKGIGRILITPEFSKEKNREKGYVYFQDFISNNDSDIRVIIIGDKAFGIKRMVRPNDFRASGSGDIIYDISNISMKVIEIAFSISQHLSSQCIAFDFVFDNNNEPLIVEISYGFSVSAYELCPGYWDEKLNWYSESIDPQTWMIEGVINTINVD